ncbi:hypothetical protein BFW01_g1075 [Lasiodiplodia theobromae]|uniref:Uncharacterized protein n=1 Tax=Lasiodiplodia theobromae TaxID=45133 RepID=A0A8H7IRA2_9PEZI|nr:hypothetical protein BFW01_g1075 [Lasiodiplodia theobromae]
MRVLPAESPLDLQPRLRTKSPPQRCFIHAPGAVAAASPCICEISARSELRYAALTTARAAPAAATTRPPRWIAAVRFRAHPPSWDGALARHPRNAWPPASSSHRIHSALYHDTNLILRASRSKTSARQSS